jgi:Lrp/AsnC family leucine-responsive transcriptional regulator
MVSERDIIILNELRRNAKLSSRSLAKKVGLPISTVYRRIKEMEENGIIKGYHAIVDFDKVGKPVGVLLLINLAEGREFIPIGQIKEELRKKGDLLQVLTVHGGEIDMIARVRLKSLNEITPFLEKIRDIEGIEEISCLIETEELDLD